MGGEFDLIQQYFVRPGEPPGWLKLGIGDDAAVVSPPHDVDLVASMDTLQSGVHFPENLDPHAIGYRALAANLSDLAAMGAKPAWVLLSLSIPKCDDHWLRAFAAGFFELADLFDVVLAGGDTVRGPLGVSIQANGWVATGQALTRAGAAPGDVLFVSGAPGEAACGLAVLQGRIPPGGSTFAAAVVQRFKYPMPRVAEGRALAGLATAVIDVSDGLAADAAKLAAASGCGLLLDLARLPVSPPLAALCSPSQALDFVLQGGDDYELVFSVAERDAAALRDRAAAWQLPITRIGRLIAEPGAWQEGGGGRRPLELSGWDHFSD